MTKPFRMIEHLRSLAGSLKKSNRTPPKQKHTVHTTSFVPRKSTWQKGPRGWRSRCRRRRWSSAAGSQPQSARSTGSSGSSSAEQLRRYRFPRSPCNSSSTCASAPWPQPRLASGVPARGLGRWLSAPDRRPLSLPRLGWRSSAGGRRRCSPLSISSSTGYGSGHRCSKTRRALPT